MTDEVRDPELDGVRDAWHAPLPRREMHEQIVWACNRELHRTNFLPKESWWRFAAVAALVLVAAFAALTIGLRTHRPVNLALPESLQEPPREPVVPEETRSWRRGKLRFLTCGPLGGRPSMHRIAIQTCWSRVFTR